MPKMKKTPVTIRAAIITVVGGGVFVLIASVLTPIVQHQLDKPVTVESTDESSYTNPIADYFPLFLGSTRTYTVGNSTPQIGGGDGLVEFISTYTEKVILVESSPYEAIHIYKVEQTGEIYDLDCTGWSTIKGP